jgi:hypothetical protein
MIACEKTDETKEFLTEQMKKANFAILKRDYHSDFINLNMFKSDIRILK